MLYLQCFCKDNKRLKRAKVNILFSIAYQFYKTIFVNSPLFTVNRENEVQKHRKSKRFDEILYKVAMNILWQKRRHQCSCNHHSQSEKRNNSDKNG